MYRKARRKQANRRKNDKSTNNCILISVSYTHLIESGTTAGGLADPLIDATAALLVNADTGMVLYEKNADERRYPASTTKVMTALLTLEHVEDLEEIVTAQESDFENVTADSSNADIKVGEQVRVIDLLYALMLPSANEAAYMLARHVGGSYEEFVNMMNARAQELGCTGTHFSNPCGLHADDHYSCLLYTSRCV